MTDRTDATRTSDSPGTDDVEVAFRQREVVRGALELTAHLTDAIRAHEFTANSEIIALNTIRLAGPQRAHELGDATGMTRAGTTNMIDRLEAGGLVRRESVESDHRGVLVELTAAGVTATEAIADRLTETMLAHATMIASWGEHLVALGLDVGSLQLPAGRVERRLEWLARFAASGAPARQMYDAAFGDVVPGRDHLLHLLLLATEPGGTRPRDVAEAVLLSSATVSDLLARAEEADLITRTSGRKPDRRATVIEATPAGREALDAALRASQPTLVALAAVLFPA